MGGFALDGFVTTNAHIPDGLTPVVAYFRQTARVIFRGGL
jgi:hypothetical protein